MTIKEAIKNNKLSEYLSYLVKNNRDIIEILLLNEPEDFLELKKEVYMDKHYQ